MVLFIFLTAFFALAFNLVEYGGAFLEPHLPSLQHRSFRIFRIFLVLVLTLVFLLWLRRKWWASPMARKMRADFAAGDALVHTVYVAEAMIVLEHEDEGQTVFVKTTEDETLVFHGQDLELFTKRGFPWQQFEIVEAPQSRFFLKLRRLAPAFNARKFAGPLPYAEAKEYGLFQSRWKPLDVPYDTILQRRAAQAQL
jgi:hypothetical protein